MDFVNAPYEDITTMGQRTTDGNTTQVDDYNNKVDELFGKVDKLEQRVNEVEEFFLNAKLKEPSTSKSALIIKDKEKEKHIPSKKKLQQDASRGEAASSKRMLMRQFGSIFRQEKIREEEEAEAQMNMQLAQEAAHAKMARDISNELNDIDLHIEELREMVVQKCRPISNEEKRQLGVALSKLCPEDLSKALEIVAQNNHNFQATAEEVDLDLNAQSESTLWRLKFFVKDALKGQCKSSCKDDKHNVTSPDAANMHNNNIVSIRKREICDALAMTAKKRKKKPAS